MTISLPKTDSFKNLQIKILYWGPGEAGKTTCFYRLLDVFSEYRISKGFSIATTDERTLWNDSVHLSFPIVKMNINLVTNVTTTTGQERFLSTREYILQNADGAIFIADSDPLKMDNNIRSFGELLTFTRRNKIPIVIQLNKIDLPDAIGLDEFKKKMGLPQADCDKDGLSLVYKTVAVDPEHSGVKDAFFSLIHKILRRKFVSD